MKIDKKLKLTFEIETARGKCFVYADPIATDVFKTYFMTIAKAHHKLFSDGVQFALMSGHRIAAMTIEDVAKRDGDWEGNLSFWYHHPSFQYLSYENQKPQRIVPFSCLDT